MMMVGSALSFDLDASRLIYTSNTWHLVFFANKKKEFKKKKQLFHLFVISILNIHFLHHGNSRKSRSK